MRAQQAVRFLCFGLLQESCVNVRCLGFPASWWHYAPVLSIIEATAILKLPSIKLDEASHPIASRTVRERQMPGVSSVFMTLCAFPLYYRSGRHNDVSHTATRLLSEQKRFWAWLPMIKKNRCIPLATYRQLFSCEPQLLANKISLHIKLAVRI